MENGIFDSVMFRYRKSIPTNPTPGAFYWVEDKNETKLFFTNIDRKLVRLDSAIHDLISKDKYNYINVSNKNEDDVITISLKYGSLSETGLFDENGNPIQTKLTKGIATSENVEKYVKSTSNSIINYVNSTSNEIKEQITNSSSNIINYINQESIKYNTKATDDWRTEKVGGIEQGMTKSDFENKTISDVLDDIIFPTLQPNVVQPSVSLSLKSEIKNIIQALSGTLPKQEDFIYTANKGSLTYGSSLGNGNKSYAGSSIEIGFTDSWMGNSHPSEGKYSTKYKYTFTDGGIPYDNKNQPSTKVPQFTEKIIESNTIDVYAVFPIYINNGDLITKMKKQNLVNYLSNNNITINVTIPGEKEGDNKLNRFNIHLPNSVTLVKVLEFNGGTGKYDTNVTMSKYEEDDNYEETGTTYFKYYRTGALTTGTAKYEITIKYNK